MSDETAESLRILALEPYFGGSHRTFLEEWSRHSRHRFCVLDLPPHKWKWRMRQSAVTFAERLAAPLLAATRFDCIFCSDMLNLAEFRGLAPPWVRRLPAVVYFHENQVTYPVQHEKERDYHFGLTNLTTGLAAERIWFNSAFHRRSFLDALPAFLRRMPDHRPLSSVESLRRRSDVQPPGIEAPGGEPVRDDAAPLHVLWVARWEFDKDPETFFRALRRLQRRRVPFRVSVLGESFRRVPDVFAVARQELAAEIEDWGFVADREEYRHCLRCADVVVSTARHEFFGLGVLEAMAAGATPLLPDRLSYPEILGDADSSSSMAAYLYEGGAGALAQRLEALALLRRQGPLDSRLPRARARRYLWSERAPALDDALAAVVVSTAAKS